MYHPLYKNTSNINKKKTTVSCFVYFIVTLLPARLLA